VSQKKDNPHDSAPYIHIISKKMSEYILFDNYCINDLVAGISKMVEREQQKEDYIWFADGLMVSGLSVCKKRYGKFYDMKSIGKVFDLIFR